VALKENVEIAGKLLPKLLVSRTTS